MDLTITVINYNTREALQRCLTSLRENLPRDAADVMVIDNASSDGSVSMVRSRFGSQVNLVANKTNLGFARAVNQALESCDSRYVLILNADTEIPEGSVEALHEFMEENPKAGLAGGKLLDSEGNLQHSCRKFYTLSTIIYRRTPLGKLRPGHPVLRDHLMQDWDHNDARTVDWMQGACLMLRREALEQVGAMDEQFFLYFEDVDLCRRLAEGGWGVYYVPEAVFTHHYRRGSHGGGISHEKLHHVTSGFRYLMKWNPSLRWLSRLWKWLTPLPLILIDLMLINFGFILCLYIRNQVGGPLAPESTQLETYYPILGGSNGLLFMAFSSMGQYRVERTKDWLSTCAVSIKAITWVALAGMVIIFFAPGYRHGFVYSRLTFLLYYIFLVFTISGSRLCGKLFFRHFWRHHLLLQRVLVVGEDTQARQMADRIRTDPICGYQVVSTFCLSKSHPDEEDEKGEVTARFLAAMTRHRPNSVIFVAHHRSFQEFTPKLLYCFKRNLEVRVATSHKLLPFIQRQTGHLCGRPANSITRTSMYSLKQAIKRVSDLALTSVALLVSLPFLLLFGLVIRLQDSGPVFFVQKRVGKDGRPFGMLKLRTMKVDATIDARANIAEGPLTMIPNDPRVTPFGRWLRRHKMDEIPQLFNVLRGQMSLVGPRPPTIEEVEEYKVWQRGRLAVQPGLTGLWQIDKQRKWRFNEMVELDLQYILHWSLMLDFSVMFRTIPAIIRGS